MIVCLFKPIIKYLKFGTKSIFLYMVKGSVPLSLNDAAFQQTVLSE